MSRRTEFDGRSFGIEPVVGVRSYFFRKNGDLVGVRGHIWTSGEQVAGCRRWIHSRSKNHDMRTCTCGFYAYTDGVPNALDHRDRIVHGVVEGYGKVTIGTRGFRAEKARLIALALPDIGGDRKDDPTTLTPSARVNRQQEIATDNSRRMSRVAVLYALLGLSGAVQGTFSWNTVISVLLGLGLALFLFLRNIRRSNYLDPDCPGAASGKKDHLYAYQLSRCRCSRHPLSPKGQPYGLSDIEIRRLRMKYPDLSVYPTVAAMNAAYGLGDPPPPSHQNT